MNAPPRQDEQNMNADTASDDNRIGDHGPMPANENDAPEGPPRRTQKVAPFWDATRPLVLVIDPDADASRELIRFCSAHGIRTALETSAAAGLIAYGRTSPDAVLISPGINDIPLDTITAALSADGQATLLLIGNPTDQPAGSRVQSIEWISDYPEGAGSGVLRELAARGGRDHGPDTELTFGTLTLRPASFEAKDNGKPIQLTLREFELLRVLMKQEGRAVSSETLKEEVWGAVGETVKPQTLKVHMNRLRQKLTGNVRPIAVRGIGYRLNKE